MPLVSSLDQNGFYDAQPGNPFAGTAASPSDIAGQICSAYITDPTAEGIRPRDENAAAITYSRDGTGQMFTWDTATHTWI